MRASLSIAVAAVTLALAPTVHAANPTVADCLSATETSLKLRTDHKLRAARAQVLTCSAASCPGVVREECARRMDEINAALPSIVFTVKTRAGDELAAVKITMNGEVVATHLDGSALVLDPGSHDFTFQAAGQAPVSRRSSSTRGRRTGASRSPSAMQARRRPLPLPRRRRSRPSPGARRPAEPRAADRRDRHRRRRRGGAHRRRRVRRAHVLELVDRAQPSA